MKNTTKFIIALILIAVLAMIGAFIFVGRGGDDSAGSGETAEDPALELNEDGYEMPEEEMVLEDDPTTKEYDNGIYFDEEGEGAEISLRKSSVTDFYGTWQATSGQAAYFYGNVEITINGDKTWKGNITDEPLKGRWQEKGGGLYLTSEIFNCDLNFSSEGNLLMQEDYGDEYDDDAVIVVLTRK